MADTPAVSLQPLRLLTADVQVAGAVQQVNLRV